MNVPLAWSDWLIIGGLWATGVGAVVWSTCIVLRRLERTLPYPIGSRPPPVDPGSIELFAKHIGIPPLEVPRPEVQPTPPARKPFVPPWSRRGGQ